jgi:hypothetical protein
MNAPRYVVLVMVDEPKASAETPEATGGVVAAPVVREVVLKAAPLLGVLPAENTSEVPDEKKGAPKAPAKPPVKPAAKPAAPAASRLERAATE